MTGAELTQFFLIPMNYALGERRGNLCCDGALEQGCRKGKQSVLDP